MNRLARWLLVAGFAACLMTQWPIGATFTGLPLLLLTLHGADVEEAHELDPEPPIAD